MQIHYLFGTDPPCSKLLETSFGEGSQPSCVTLCASVCPLLLLQVIHAGRVLNTCNITAWHEIVVVFEGGIANLRPQEYTLCQGGCEPNMGWIIATRLGESCSDPAAKFSIKTCLSPACTVTGIWQRAHDPRANEFACIACMGDSECMKLMLDGVNSCYWLTGLTGIIHAIVCKTPPWIQNFEPQDPAPKVKRCVS